MSLNSAVQKQNSETVETYNPANGELYKTYNKQTKQEAEGIIELAYEAFKSWRQTSLKERAEIVGNIAKELENNKQDLAEMMAKQMGKPISQGEQEVDVCIAICKYTAENGPEILQEEKREVDGGTGIISYEPIGVILGMQPWNFPCYQALRYSVANFMAGNTTVFKHAEICWETADKLQQIFENAGLPKNVFSVVYVDDETVDELIEHDKIRAVTFTGSAEAGKIIAEKSGKVLKKTVLELGGSDPYIILDDVEIEDVVKTCVKGRINNAGQTCVAAKRFIVLEGIYDEFKENFVKAMEGITYGDPIKDEDDMGPMSKEDLRDDLHEQVQKSVEKGAKLLCGGKVPDEKGFYYPATILENPQPGSPAYDDELFGPVAVLFKAKDEEDAIRIANDHRYGLGGGVFSKDADRAKQIAHKIDTGMVNVNGYNLSQPNMPFGGVKESGYGREHGGFGMKEFVNIKSIVISEDS